MVSRYQRLMPRGVLENPDPGRDHLARPMVGHTDALGILEVKRKDDRVGDKEEAAPGG